MRRMWPNKCPKQVAKSLSTTGIQQGRGKDYHVAGSSTATKLWHVQEKGCYTLRCVEAAYPSNSKLVFEESSGLDAVISALPSVQGHESNYTATKRACTEGRAMCSMCLSNALYAVLKEALGYLVASFEHFREASKSEGGGKRSKMGLVRKAFMDLLSGTEN